MVLPHIKRMYEYLESHLNNLIKFKRSDKYLESHLENLIRKKEMIQKILQKVDQRDEFEGDWLTLAESIVSGAKPFQSKVIWETIKKEVETK